MITIPSLLLMVALAVDPKADPAMQAPPEAKTIAEIVAAAEKEDLRGGLRNKAEVSTAEFRNDGLATYVLSYNPYSGIAATHVYIYSHDTKKGVWRQQLAKIFRNTQHVTVEGGLTILIRNAEGKVIHKYQPKE